LPALLYGHCVTTTGLSCYRRIGRCEGCRLYCREDLGRLERILVLRYPGLSLCEIAALLSTPVGRGADPLTVTLARQRAALRERRDSLDRVLRTIEHTQLRAQDPAEPEWLLYQTILKEIQMQEDTDWTEKYYSPKALEALRERRAALTPEQKSEIGARWKALFVDLQSALEREVPADSVESRALVARCA
jgi:DNA-binding transcriptional MerR regulator